MDIPVKPFPHGKPFETEADSPAEVIRRARVILTPRGAWRKGALTGPGGSRCLLQALRDADGKHFDAASKFVTAETKHMSIPAFNDSSLTRKHHVLDVLDRAYERAQKEAKA